LFSKEAVSYFAGTRSVKPKAPCQDQLPCNCDNLGRLQCPATGAIARQKKKRKLQASLDAARRPLIFRAQAAPANDSPVFQLAQSFGHRRDLLGRAVE
jgi:hypothetical protein